MRDKYVSADELDTILKDEIAALLSENNTDNYSDFTLPEGKKPYVVMVVGVNGVGKTTTIGKLAYQYKKRGKSVMLAVPPTPSGPPPWTNSKYGANARGVHIVEKGMGADPASVAFDTLNSALSKGVDLVLIDTAGRLRTTR